MSKKVLPWKYAELTGRSLRNVYRMLYAGRIDGAEKREVNGHQIWSIPEDAPWPEDKRYIKRTGYIDD
jgi:hypothetical protein